ncbi:MAG: DNA primase, partial [Aquificaceae bacterium]
GSNYSARCPFHQDDIPSLFVSPTKGIWKCFGCGVGGDAIKFVALYENISYSEALIKVSKKYNIPLRSKRQKKDEKLLKALELVAEFYMERLKGTSFAIDYLKERAVSSRSAHKFMLGFSKSSEELVKFLKEKSLLEVYERTGNIIKIDDGVYRDLFVNRLTIPIKDERGRVIAFGGRVIHEGQPKYINSPESDFFRKREVLFGLYEAKDYIMNKGHAIVVEGYFDVISMHDEGLKNTVAPLGTSLTKEHAQLLRRYTKEVLLLFDGDDAGRRAVWQSLPHLISEGIRVKVLYLPEGTDPDTMLKSDKEYFKQLLSRQRDIFDLLLENAKDRKTLEEILHFAGFIKDSIEKHDTLRKISNVTNIPVSVLYESISKPSHEEKDQDLQLTYLERVFLLGLMKFGVQEVNLKELLLSPRAMEMVEHILSGDYHFIPKSVKNTKVYSLESAFKECCEILKIKQDEFMESPKSIKEVRNKKEIVRFRKRI